MSRSSCNCQLLQVLVQANRTGSSTGSYSCVLRSASCDFVYSVELVFVLAFAGNRFAFLHDPEAPRISSIWETLLLGLGVFRSQFFSLNIAVLRYVKRNATDDVN